ncbi:hypothetical protein DPMN_019487 [Dreissena polymorpha]|uniref:Uncharacterized protein n=1 Tax=Dreissena polymorpha TaxID=45954 RepID=A0A9D4NH53_DREPO|nr:hypothetical protein DPMN_019487 [Dreissena polymorpha]
MIKVNAPELFKKLGSQIFNGYQLMIIKLLPPDEGWWSRWGYNVGCGMGGILGCDGWTGVGRRARGMVWVESIVVSQSLPLKQEGGQFRRECQVFSLSNLSAGHYITVPTFVTST